MQNKYKLNRKSTADEIIAALDSIGAKETILHSECEKDCSIHDICIENIDEVRMFPAYDENDKIVYMIHIYVNFHWNEQTWPGLIDFRRRCRKELGHELLLVDFDMCQLTHNKLNHLFFDNKINTIKKICKKHNISLVYLTYTSNGSIGLIKEDIYHELNKKQKKGYKKLVKYFKKHIKRHFELFTYYCDDNLTQIKYDHYFENEDDAEIYSEWI